MTMSDYVAHAEKQESRWLHVREPVPWALQLASQVYWRQSEVAWGHLQIVISWQDADLISAGFLKGVGRGDSWVGQLL